MTRALRTLLGAAIDYAGLFPPAKLPLEEAAVNYARYRDDPDAWMLGKFICPASRLDELAALVPVSPTPWSVSALGRGGDTLAAWLDGLTRDLARIERTRLSVSAFETRLPAEAFTTPDGLARCLDAFQRPGEGIFLEVPAGPGFLDRAHATIDALRQWPGAGLKIRCGGLDATAFPDAHTVVDVLLTAAIARVPLKATAGLHHPLRRWDDGLQTWMHGFINLFFAGLLVRVSQATRFARVELLLDRDPDSFHFLDDGFSWRGFAWTLRAVEAMRAEQILSFGSCSFDEPRDDLRELGWLAAPGGDT